MLSFMNPADLFITDPDHPVKPYSNLNIDCLSGTSIRDWGRWNNLLASHFCFNLQTPDIFNTWVFSPCYYQGEDDLRPCVT